MNPMVYLAHPIDQVGNPGSFMEVVNNLHGLCVAKGFPVYTPARAWSLNPRVATPTPVLQGVNEFALLSASHVVVVLPAEQASIGVPYELAQAIGESQTRVAVVYDHRLLSTSWVVPHILQQVDAAVAYTASTGELHPGGLDQLNQFLTNPDTETNSNV